MMRNDVRNSITVSIIVPAYNAEETLQKCLQALMNDCRNGTEIIVVDDHSTDRSASLCRQMGIRVVEMERRVGPGAARNAGVERAKGNIIFFVDADVVIGQNTIPHILETFEKKPELAAVFGSYDNDPPAANFLSQFKNLFHHYVHQNSKEEAVTFWAGCGAIRKDIFLSVGGFNERAYRRPSIEDIELGFRLWQNHHPIRLDKGLQVKHLKRWSWSSLLRTDILHRAYPWSNLILTSSMVPADLNLKTSYRLSAILVAFLVFLIPLLALTHRRIGFPNPVLIALFVLGVLTALIILNRHLYQFFFKRKGFLFTLQAVFCHLLYYCYSGMTFLLCWFRYKLKSALTDSSTV